MWPPQLSAQECLTGLLPYDEDDSYENFADQLEHLEDQANHIETVLPPKLDAAHDLQSVLGATVIGQQRAGKKLLFDWLISGLWTSLLNNQHRSLNIAQLISTDACLTECVVVHVLSCPYFND